MRIRRTSKTINEIKKKNKWKKGEMYLTVSFGFFTPSLWERGKRGLCEKEIIVVILSMK